MHTHIAAQREKESLKKKKKCSGQNECHKREWEKKIKYNNNGK